MYVRVCVCVCVCVCDFKSKTLYNKEPTDTRVLYVQWNLSITGPRKCVLIREVSSFQRLICTQKYTIGTSETVLVLISEVSFKRGSTVHTRTHTHSQAG